MPKPPLRHPSNPRAEQDELVDIMAMLEQPAADEDDEPVDSGDLVALLEGLGASAKERDEEEVRSLLEGMPELGEDGNPRDSAEEAVPMLEDDGDDEGSEAVVNLQSLFSSGRSRLVREGVQERNSVRARVEPASVVLGDEEDFLALEAVAPSLQARQDSLQARRMRERSAQDGEIPPVQPLADDPLLPPLRDPLASRRLLGDKRLKQFVEEDIGSRLKFRIMRMLLVGGLERVSLDEFQEELVESREALKAALSGLDSAGLLLIEPAGYSVNPRARKLVLLGTAVAHWQSPRHRSELLGWLTD